MSFLTWLSNITTAPHDKPSTSIKTDTHMSSLKMVSGDVLMASMKIKKMLHSSGETLCTIFSAIECAENPADLERALERFNKVMRILYVAAPDIDHNGLIIDALKKLRCSERFERYLGTSRTVKDAVSAYKTEIVKKLDFDFQRREELSRLDQAFDKALLTCYLTKTKSEILVPKQTIACVTLPEPDLKHGESGNNKVVTSNKCSYSIQPNIDGLSTSKKRKLRDVRAESEDETICSSYRRGTCRRKSRCNYRH